MLVLMLMLKLLLIMVEVIPELTVAQVAAPAFVLAGGCSPIVNEMAGQ